MMPTDYEIWRAANAERLQREAVTKKRGIDVVRRYRAGESLDALATEYGVHKATIERLLHYAEVLAARFSELAPPQQEQP